jgi:ABC-2 type transport system permease protein
MTALTQPAHLAPPSLARLAAVELRKMIDTRAGFWLLVLVAFSAIALVTAALAGGSSDDQAMAGLFGGCLTAVSVLLPLVGLLAVTSEWSQRTALTTFTLVPERGRVAAAKLLAGSSLALASVLACLVAAAVGNLIAGGSWSFGLSNVFSGTLYELLVMLGALALGLMLMNSALAIVTIFVAPMVVVGLVSAVPSLGDASAWFDLQLLNTLAQDDMVAGDWPRLAVNAAIWVGLPLALGLLRLRRREVS